MARPSPHHRVGILHVHGRRDAHLAPGRAPQLPVLHAALADLLEDVIEVAVRVLVPVRRDDGRAKRLGDLERAERDLAAELPVAPVDGEDGEERGERGDERARHVGEVGDVFLHDARDRGEHGLRGHVGGGAVHDLGRGRAVEVQAGGEGERVDLAEERDGRVVPARGVDVVVAAAADGFVLGAVRVGVEDGLGLRAEDFDVPLFFEDEVRRGGVEVGEDVGEGADGGDLPEGFVEVVVGDEFDLVDLLVRDGRAEGEGGLVEEFDVRDDVAAFEFFFAGYHYGDGILDHGRAYLARAARDIAGAGSGLLSAVGIGVQHVELDAGVGILWRGPVGMEGDVPKRERRVTVRLTLVLQSVVDVLPLRGAVVRKAESFDRTSALLTERTPKERGLAFEGVVHLAVCDLSGVGIDDIRPCGVHSLDRVILARNAAAILRPLSSDPRRHRAVHISCLLRDGRLCRLLEEGAIHNSKLGHESGQSDGVEVSARLENSIEAIRVGMVAMQCVQRAPPQCLPPPRNGQTLCDHGQQPQVLHLVRNVEQHVRLYRKALKRPVLHPLVIADPQDGHSHGRSHQHRDKTRKARPRKLFAPTRLPIDAVVVLIIFLLLRELVHGLWRRILRIPHAAHRADGPGSRAPLDIVLGMHVVDLPVPLSKVRTQDGKDGQEGVLEDIINLS